jgi:hypothetical protein
MIHGETRPSGAVLAIYSKNYIVWLAQTLLFSISSGSVVFNHLDAARIKRVQAGYGCLAGLGGRRGFMGLFSNLRVRGE